jgi:hypothetical protein
MMRTVAAARCRGATAELRRDPVHLTERPVAAAIIKLENGARPHRHGIVGRGRRLFRPRLCSAQRWLSIWAASSETSRDQPSVVLKATMRTGLCIGPPANAQ